MAVSTYLVGNDGDVSIGIAGTAATNLQTLIKVSNYSANLSRVSTDLTGFGDTGRRRRLGIIDMTGSVSGVLGIDATATANTSSFFTNTMDPSSTSTACTVSLAFWTGTAATTQAKIVGTVVFGQFSFGNNKMGDATVSGNFELAGGSAPVVTWYI